MTDSKLPKIVVIGASFAGLHAATVISKLFSKYIGSITVIGPSTDAYYNVAAPRILVQPDLFAAAVIPIEKNLAQMAGNKAKFVRGTVTKVDLDKKIINYTYPLTKNTAQPDPEDLQTDSAEEVTAQDTLSYDIVIVATGTTTAFPGFKENLDINAAKSSLLEINRVLNANVKKVAVIGAGPTGVEVAGEIASSFSRTEITLFTGKTAPLIDYGLSAAATSQLTKLGVSIVNNVKAAGDQLTGLVTLPDGSTENFDVIINCFPKGPNSSFLPDSVLDSKKFVVTNGLQVKGYENSAFAIGDIVSGSPATLVDLKYGQSSLFFTSFRSLVSKWGTNDQLAEFPTYSPFKKIIVVPIGPNGGVGKIYFVRLASFLVKVIKSKSFMIENTHTFFE